MTTAMLAILEAKTGTDYGLVYCGTVIVDIGILELIGRLIG